MKLTVGSGLALALAHFIGLEPQVRAWRPQPDLVEWVSVLLAAFSFAVLFRARCQDYPVVILAAVGGYLISRLGGQYLGAPAGIFLSALVLTAAGNGYARWAQRHGEIGREPV